MSKLNALKDATALVAGIGTFSIVRQVIDNNVVSTNLLNRVYITVGAIGVSVLVADVTHSYVGARLDRAAASTKAFLDSK